MTAAELNEIASQCAAELDAYIGNERTLDARLRGSLFLSIERRARDGLRPAMTDDHRAIVDRFPTPWQ